MAINLNDISNSVSQSASQAKSVAQTKSSLVSTGIKDTLVAVDGYGKSTSTVLSNMTNTILGKLSDTKNFLLNTKIADLGSLNDALTAASQVKADATALANQLSSEIGQSINTVKGISDSVINSATSTLSTINNTVDSTFNAVNGGISSTINSASSILNANNFITSVNTLLSSAKLTFENLEDKLSMTALKSSILQQAAYLGLTNVIDSVYASDSTNTTLTGALGDSLESALASGNITLVKSMVNNLGGTYIIQRSPTAIQLILQNYRFTTTVSVNDYGALATELITVLNSIDANWNTSQSVNSGHMLSVFRSISSSAKAVLMTLPEYQYQITVVPHYSDSDVLSAARSQYTYIALA